MVSCTSLGLNASNRKQQVLTSNYLGLKLQRAEATVNEQHLRSKTSTTGNRAGLQYAISPFPRTSRTTNEGLEANKRLFNSSACCTFRLHQPERL